MDTVKYPWIVHRHQLEGPTGNAYVIMGAVAETMRNADIPEAEIRQCMKEATSGNYENLLATMRRWIDFRTENDD